MQAARRATYRYMNTHPTLRHAEAEVLSDALLGACQARLAWREDGGASLGTYAEHRAYGSILDEQRRRSPISRWQAQHGMTSDNCASQYQHPVSIDQLRGYGFDVPSEPVESELEQQDAVNALLRFLPHRERTVVYRCDVLGEHQQTVAADMGLTPSRVCQIRKAALYRLRDVA